ncbi:MAG: hypothetical protein AB1635_01150 [Acidobacteriota bacterium]
MEASEIRLEPFPHAIINGLLPDEIYEALVAAIRPRVFFEDRAVNRQQLTVPFDLASRRAREVWTFATSVIVGAILGPACTRRFDTQLREHVASFAPGAPLSEGRSIWSSLTAGSCCVGRDTRSSLTRIRSGDS